MLAVEAVTDSTAVVDSVNDPIGVVLHGGREYDYLVEFAKLRQKFIAIWSNHVKEIVLAILELLQVFLIIRILILGAHKVYQSFIQVEN